MKKAILVLTVFSLFLVSCERVAPNYAGVLMENYGKNGKSDYSIVKGKVNTMAPGSELFQVPLWEQRAEFNNEEGGPRILHMNAADNTEFTANPLYSYKAIENRVIDLVFKNARLGSGEEFMRKLEDNVLEPRIYDILKEGSKGYITDSLMVTGGSLKYERHMQDLIKKVFEEQGLELLTFSPNLGFSQKVKEKIDNRNEVNTNITVIDQQIVEQRKRNELAELKAQENIIVSKGLTPQILQLRAIEAWEKTKTPIYGNGFQFYKQIQ